MGGANTAGVGLRLDRDQGYSAAMGQRQATERQNASSSATRSTLRVCTPIALCWKQLETEKERDEQLEESRRANGRHEARHTPNGRATSGVCERDV